MHNAVEVRDEIDRALNHVVSIKCMGWHIGTMWDWCKAHNLETGPEPDQFDLKAVWLDDQMQMKYDVDGWDPECGRSWSPATHLEHAWDVVQHMKVQGVQFDIGAEGVSCRVHRDSMHGSGSGQCPAEALSKALIALKEA